MLDFDPNDPDDVSVHYDNVAWGFDQHADLPKRCRGEGAARVGRRGTGAAENELMTEVNALFDELEPELGPFPIVLDADPESTEFGLDEWCYADLETLTDSLIASEIPYLWQAHHGGAARRRRGCRHRSSGRDRSGRPATGVDEAPTPPEARADHHVPRR